MDITCFSDKIGLSEGLAGVQDKIAVDMQDTVSMGRYIGWLPFEIPSRRAADVDLLVDMNQIGGWFDSQN